MILSRLSGVVAATVSVCCLVFLLVDPGAGFTLKASHIQLTFDADESLTLTCSHQLQEALVDTKLVGVREMRLMKRVGKRTWKNITEIWLNDPRIRAEEGIDVIGQVVNDITQSYLTAVWYHTSPVVLGVYRCDIIGVNANKGLTEEKTNFITIFDNNATTQDMLMSSQEQLDSLQLEFNKYRSDTEEKFKTFRKELQNVRHLVQQQTIMANDTSDLVANLSKQLREEMLEKFTSLQADIRVNTSTCPCSGSKPEGTSDDKKEEPGSAEGSDTGSETGGATSKEEVVITTPSPEPEADDERRNNTWPEQMFGLLMPESGCPETRDEAAWTSGHIGYHTESTEENRDNVSYPNHLTKPVVRMDDDGNHFMFLHFCVHGVQAEATQVNGNSSDQTLGPVQWPKGSYCINRAGGRCPRGFGSGYLDIDEEDTGHIKTLKTPLPDMLFFCCRKDAPPTRRVRLPTAKPFFLYRYGGQCQAVLDMQVTEESITIDTENVNNADGYENAFHPDGHIEDVHIELCYYS